jgi:uncharacterized phage-like protein YoqJ
MSVIIGVTGHRPPRIGGYNRDNPVRTYCRARMTELLVELGATLGITGMASGTDIDFADVCIELGVPFIAAAPFEGQELSWPAHAQVEYRKRMEKAADVRYVCAPGYDKQKYLYRDRWIVDNCHTLIAVFDGEPHGGTVYTVHYADEIKRSVMLINPRRFQ